MLLLPSGLRISHEDILDTLLKDSKLKEQTEEFLGRSVEKVPMSIPSVYVHQAECAR